MYQHLRLNAVRRPETRSSGTNLCLSRLLPSGIILCLAEECVVEGQQRDLLTDCVVVSTSRNKSKNEQGEYR